VLAVDALLGRLFLAQDGEALGGVTLPDPAGVSLEIAVMFSFVRASPRNMPLAVSAGGQPFRSNTGNSSGIAVISLDFASGATWPKTNALALAQALTPCSAALPRSLSCERRSVFPSIAITWPAVGDQDNVQQEMVFRRIDPRILQGCETGSQRAQRHFFQGEPRIPVRMPAILPQAAQRRI
jgi:hypothetical protein